MEVRQIASLTRFIHNVKSSRQNPSRYRLYDKSGISQAICTMQGGGLQPLIIKDMDNKYVDRGNFVSKQNPDGTFENRSYNRVWKGNGKYVGAIKCTKEQEILTDFRIRKLTERECFRLMGVRDGDIDKLLNAGISKSQLYKMAGNSIVCDCLMKIFDKMVVNTEPTRGTQLSIF